MCIKKGVDQKRRAYTLPKEPWPSTLRSSKSSGPTFSLVWLCDVSSTSISLSSATDTESAWLPAAAAAPSPSWNQQMVYNKLPRHWRQWARQISYNSFAFDFVHEHFFLLVLWLIKVSYKLDGKEIVLTFWISKIGLKFWISKKLCILNNFNLNTKFNEELNFWLHYDQMVMTLLANVTATKSNCVECNKTLTKLYIV